MENLIQKKEEIVRHHTAKMGEINARILQLLNEGIEDKKTGAGVKLDLVNLSRRRPRLTGRARQAWTAATGWNFQGGSLKMPK